MPRVPDEGAPPQRTVILEHEALRELDGFTQIPNVVLKHPGLSYGAKVAWGVLMSYAWQKDFCFPAQDRLARDMNCTVRQVQRLLVELKTAGFVHWKQQGLNRPNIYYLRIPTLPDGSPTPPKSSKHKDTTNMSPPDTTYLSRPDTTDPSLQDATKVSPKEDPVKKIQHVYVNVGEHPQKGAERMGGPMGLGDLLKSAVPRLELTPPRSSAMDPARVNYLADTIATELGDAKAVSLRTFRRIAAALGEETTWRLIGLTKEAARDGLITGKKGAYLVGMAKKMAEERGVDLGLRSERPAVGSS